MEPVRVIWLANPHLSDVRPQGLVGGGQPIFGQAAIDRAIARAAEKLGEKQEGIVFHLDTSNEVSVSYVQRFGDHVTVRAGVVLDTSMGFKFDKDHLAAQGDLVITF